MPRLRLRTRVQSGTGIIELLVSLGSEVRHGWCCRGRRTSESRHWLRAANSGELRNRDTSRMLNVNGPLRVGIGGPVGSGKTALMDCLCKRLRDRFEIAAITNDIYTKWDAEYLDRKRTRLNSRHVSESRMPSSA